MNPRDYEKNYEQPVRTPDIFDQWKEAKGRFDSACHSLSKAQQERASAEDGLRKATAQVASAIETAMCDPTIPMPEPPSNGAGTQGLGLGRRGY